MPSQTQDPRPCITAVIIGDGDSQVVRITVNFPRGGELTNPSHLLLLNKEYVDYNENHPQFATLAMAHRHAGDTLIEEDDAFDLLVKLPFECELDFIDPFGSADDDGIDIGVFPLDRKHYKLMDNAPLPSVKLLHLSLEEKKKKRAAQKPREKSYFS